eukprot:9175329-Pyramimonas_sp.AAC.1
MSQVVSADPGMDAWERRPRALHVSPLSADTKMPADGSASFVAVSLNLCPYRWRLESTTSVAVSLNLRLGLDLLTVEWTVKEPQGHPPKPIRSPPDASLIPRGHLQPQPTPDLHFTPLPGASVSSP